MKDPFRLLNGTFQGCEDWKNDSALWKDVTGDGIAEPFSYWWSGHQRLWNLPSANACWHSDESGPRPAVDYNGAAGTDVYFRTYHVDPSFNWWPDVIFERTVGRTGLRARLNSPSGAQLAIVHYWHVTPRANVIGTNWTYHFDVPGYSEAYRHIADVAASEPFCDSFAPHLHQSANTSSGATANDTGDVVGDVQFWLWWNTP